MGQHHAPMQSDHGDQLREHLFHSKTSFVCCDEPTAVRWRGIIVDVNESPAPQPSSKRSSLE